MKIEEKINLGETIRIEAGTKKAGIDIPVGRYKMINLKERYSGYLSVEIYDNDGNIVNHIFTREEQIEVVLEEGYVTRSFDVYALKRCVRFRIRC